MILRDAVHGLVSFEGDEEAVISALIDTEEVQRLRRIRQLGVAAVSFPGAEHTRFSHAIGTAWVMKKLIARLRGLHESLPYWQRLTSDRARDALAAAMLHDIGHGPLSHLFEDALVGSPHHEEWTTRIVLAPESGVHKVLRRIDPGMPERVAALVRGKHALPYLAKAVSGLLDVDRCDYLLRDAHATGVRYGLFDLDWLLRSLCFSPGVSVSGTADTELAPGLAIDGAKGLPAIEGFILARLFMFQQVYLHKATRAAEWMIRRALQRASELLQEGVRLPAAPAAMVHAAQGSEVMLANYLEMDDATLAVAMRAWEDGSDPGLAELCSRVRKRALYKTHELFGEHATRDGQLRALAIARDIAKTQGRDPDVSVGLDSAEVVPFESDDPLLVVFQKGPARRLEEVSFVLSRLAGERLTRVRLILPKELRGLVAAALGA
jgi:uncharacterized protein